MAGVLSGIFCQTVELLSKEQIKKGIHNLLTDNILE